MLTIREAVLQAIRASLQVLTAPDRRNEGSPERVLEAGIVILRDGDPGEPDITLNPRTAFYSHRVELELFVTQPTAGGGEGLLDALLADVHAAHAANPSPGDTITLNATVWTFVSGTASANETEIQGTLIQTLDALVDDLNASADVEIVKCTYGRPPDAETVTITFDPAGPSGNGFTLAASAASGSGPTLTGGGYSHVWKCGGDDIPSFTVELGHPLLTTPVFFRHTGTVIEGLSFEMGQEARRMQGCSWWPRAKSASPPQSTPAPMPSRSAASARGAASSAGVASRSPASPAAA